MGRLNNVFISVLMILVVQSGYSQSFPPPTNLLVEINGNDPILTWNAPSKDLVYYNIYRNNLLVGNTTGLEYTDTVQFVYYNEWYVTAVYANPNGESDPSNIEVISIFIGEPIPYFENFDYEIAIWSTRVITGETEWKLVDSISFSGTQSAGCYSSVNGNNSILYSRPIIGNLAEEIQLSFWYKCPSENSISDELRVYKIDWSGDTILISDVLTNQNQWIEKKINLGDLDVFHISFESISKGGGGVFVDSIGITEIFTSINETMNVDKIQLYQNIPNPFNVKTKLGFFLPKDEKIKLTVYNINGQLLKIILDEKLQSGEHFIDYYQMALSPGIYYYSIETMEEKLVKKLILK